MNDETEAYHLADIEECRGGYDSSDYHYQGKRYRVKELNNSQEAPKRRNERAKVGTECRCPMCGKKFVKKVSNVENVVEKKITYQMENHKD